MINGEFDIVHVQGLCSLRFNVVTAHICNYAYLKMREKRGLAVGYKEKIKDRIYQVVVVPLERMIYKYFKNSCVIAISKMTGRMIAAHYGSQSKMEVVHHGVDAQLFNPGNKLLYRSSIRQDLKADQGEFLALYAGQLSKGAGTAIKAIQKTKNIKLVVISASDHRPYQKLAQSLGVENQVIFLPHTGNIERYYAAVDAFVFPSQYEDFGLVITEAMASGLPVITNRAAGAAELIEHGKDGLLVNDPPQPEDIADQLRMLSSNKQLCRKIGAAARTKMETHTWADVAERTMNVYRQIVAE